VGERGQNSHGELLLFQDGESEQTPGDSEGQGSLVCCSSQGHKEPDDLATEQRFFFLTCFFGCPGSFSSSM